MSTLAELANSPMEPVMTKQRIEIERIAGNLVRNEVHLCLSSMVATLAQGNETWPNRNAHDLRDLCEQATDLCAPLDDWEEAAIQAGWTESPEGWCWRNPTEGEEANFYFLGSGPFVRAESIQDACDFDDIDPHQSEIFEHWAVSQRLAEDLQSLGERVDADFAGLCVWGRTTTGQMIEMDSVIQRVAQLVHDRAATLSTAADNARQPDGSISASRFLANADHIERRT